MSDKNRCIANSTVKGVSAKANGRKIRTSLILPTITHINMKITAAVNSPISADPVRYRRRVSITMVHPNGIIKRRNGR